MKKVFCLLVITFLITSAHAQLTNSKWKTTLQIDQPVDVVFSFSTDTLNVTNASDGSAVETMKYTIKDTVLTIKKLYGQSECDTASVGTYSCVVNGSDMHLVLISDDCSDRSNVIKDIKLNKTE